MQSPALSFNHRLSRNGSAAWRYLRAGPSHFFMYMLGRFQIVRSFMVWAHREKAVKVVSGVSLIESLDHEQAVQNIARDGYSCGLRLRADVVGKLQRFSLTSTCFGEEHFKLPFYVEDKAAAEQRYGRKLKVGRFDDVLESCPAIRALASDPNLLAIARGYLGAEPALLGARMWWSFASEADATQQKSLGQGFHYDLDGYRALAFFFYLTDVTMTSGPHICVRGTHIEKPLKALVSLYKSRSDAEIAEWYGTERQTVVYGTAGDGFAEDIFCFHKGLHPKREDRLILQLRYGLCNYGAKGD